MKKRKQQMMERIRKGLMEEKEEGKRKKGEMEE